MKKLAEIVEPPELRAWKAANPLGVYRGLQDDPSVRVAIRDANTRGQNYLCAYCCCEISGENSDTMNEHVVAQDLAPHQTLDFDNIVASCRTRNQCDHAHKAQPLPLTPLMQECEDELQFMLSGRVNGKTLRAKETIRVLNLGDTEASNRSLINQRKQLIDAMLYCNGVNPTDGLDDDDLIQLVLSEIETVTCGKMLPYSPTLANVLRSWLQTAI
jgi:uncharacterized protein (TIGR02646 family)